MALEKIEHAEVEGAVELKFTLILRGVGVNMASDFAGTVFLSKLM